MSRTGYELAALSPAKSPGVLEDDQGAGLARGEPAPNARVPTVPDDLAGLETTFHFMKMRQLQRMSLETLSNSRPNHHVMSWLVLFGALYAFYLCVQIYYYERTVNYVLEFILVGLASLSMSLVMGRVRPMYRVVLLEGYCALLAFFLLSLYYKTREYTALGIAAFGCVVITIGSFYSYYYIDIACKRCRMLSNWDIHKAEDDEAQTSSRYEIEQRTTCCRGCCTGDATSCIYEGPLEGGLPEGLGTWIDSSYKGECLHGYWHEGVPVGPFESTENDTRSILVNLRIICGTDAGGRFWLDKRPLRFAVASVECCVSGDFFKAFPAVHYLQQPTECNCESASVCECVRNVLSKGLYKHMDDGKNVKTVSVSVATHRGVPVINVTGHQPLHAESGQRPSEVSISVVEGQPPHLKIDGPWIGPDSDFAKEEGIVFIHGFDHNLEDTIKRFGQFLALAHLPKYIKPFVFNWPASTSHWCYWCASDLASDRDVHRDLKQFFLSITNAKIRKLHIVCHSLGSRIFLRAFPLLKEVFASLSLEDRTRLRKSLDLQDDVTQRGPTGIVGLRKIEVVNLILLNADYDMDTFQNDLKELQMYCGLVTIYGDSRDAALRLSERLTRKPKVGTIRDVNFPDSLDVVDTGDLNSNINAVAHGYFNINKMMVEDISELIVNNKPAEERTSHLKRCGHVYRFTVVPSSVMVV